MLLAQPLSILDPGKRENMEDSIFPQHGTGSINDRFFIVCDGMGGHTKGEVASMLACERFSGYFQEHGDAEVTEQFFTQAFDFVQDQFDDYLRKNREARGMGTTAALVYFTGNSAAVAHCAAMN
jgi:protein phosphatase